MVCVSSRGAEELELSCCRDADRASRRVVRRWEREGSSFEEEMREGGASIGRRTGSKESKDVEDCCSLDFREEEGQEEQRRE